MERYDLGRAPFRGSTPAQRPLPRDPWPPPAPPAAPSVPAQGKSNTLTRMILVPLLSAMLGGVLGVGGTLALAGRSEGPDVVASAASAGGGQALTGVAAVAERVIPSVVQIDTAARSRFGTRQGTGSGVIYSSDGFIVTNRHVVEGGTSFRVTLSNGDQVEGSLVGVGAGDVAVLKVNRTDLQAATFGSVDDIRVGDVAVAVGSPYGLEGTVTAGVISARDREIGLSRGQRISDLLQTDAPINPGNSGGALVNGAGEVIGINTAIVEGAGSLGFAISIDSVLREVEGIIAAA